MIYDYFPVIGSHDTVLDYAHVFSITLRNDDVQEFDARSDFIRSPGNFVQIGENVSLIKIPWTSLTAGLHTKPRSLSPATPSGKFASSVQLTKKYAWMQRRRCHERSR